MLKRASIVLATAVATILVGGIVQASPPPDPNPGATQPVREQNLDGNGWIAIHEQGIADTNITNDNIDVTLQNSELDVNVTNDSLPVAGDVDVNNFPATQDVNIVGSSATPPSVTSVVNPIFQSIEPGASLTISFDIAASTIVIPSGDDEFTLKLNSPVGGNDLYFAYEPEGDNETTSYEFPYPIPLSGGTLFCHNESDNCVVPVFIAGF